MPCSNTCVKSSIQPGEEDCNMSPFCSWGNWVWNVKWIVIGLTALMWKSWHPDPVLYRSKDWSVYWSLVYCILLLMIILLLWMLMLFSVFCSNRKCCNEHIVFPSIFWIPSCGIIGEKVIFVCMWESGFHYSFRVMRSLRIISLTCTFMILQDIFIFNCELKANILKCRSHSFSVSTQNWRD